MAANFFIIDDDDDNDEYPPGTSVTLTQYPSVGNVPFYFSNDTPSQPNPVQTPTVPVLSTPIVNPGPQLSTTTTGHDGTFSICIPDCAHLRFLMDSAAGVRSEGIITLVPDGIVMAHKNRDGTATIGVKIFEEQLLEFNVRPASGSTPQVYAHVHTSFKTVASICKTLDKKEQFQAQGRIFHNGWIYKMHNVSKDMADEIPCFNPDTSLYETYASMKEKFYKGVKPAARVTNAWLVKPMNKFKSSKYTRVNFSVVEGSVIIRGSRNNVFSIAKCPEPASQEEYQDNESRVADPRVLNYTSGVTIDLKEMKDVLVNMCKISHARSVIQIYLEENKPLVFVINLGNMGIAEFTFANSVNAKNPAGM